MTSPQVTADKTFEAMWSLQAKGSLHGAFGVFDNLGIDEQATRFAQQSDSYYYPNRRNGMLVEPAGTDPDAIPVISSEDMPRYQASAVRFHRLQRLALSAVHSPRIIDELDAACQQHDGLFHTQLNETVGASVWAPLVYTKTGTAIGAKPVVIINTHGARGELPVGAAVHELVHVAQTLENPSREHYDGLFRELQAYAVHAALVSAYDVPYDTATAMAGTVDRFRRMYMGDAIAAPDTEFRTAFAREQAFAGIVRGLDG